LKGRNECDFKKTEPFLFASKAAAAPSRLPHGQGALQSVAASCGYAGSLPHRQVLLQSAASSCGYAGSLPHRQVLLQSAASSRRCPGKLAPRTEVASERCFKQSKRRLLGPRPVVALERCFEQVQRRFARIQYAASSCRSVGSFPQRSTRFRTKRSPLLQKGHTPWQRLRIKAFLPLTSQGGET